MISRQKKYLREIIANYFGATYDDLYNLQEVSEKTLRSDIRIIQKALRKYDLAICEDKNRFYIPFEQKEAFLNAFEEIIKADEKQVLANEYQERKMYILISLCKSDDYISMNILADRLYVSKSSVAMIIHDLKDEIPRLVPTASLSVSGRKGIKLNAKEKEIRELLVRAFVKNGGNVEENQFLLNYLHQEFKDLIPNTLKAVNEFMHEENIVIAEENISKSIVHILVIAQRLQHGKCLDKEDLEDNILYDKLSKKLETIGLYINSKELSSLPLLTLNRLVIDDPIAIKAVHQFINETNEEFNEEILKIEDAFPLIAHIDEILKKRIKMSNLKEFVFDTMLQRLLSAYILSGELCTILHQYVDIDIDMENRTYIAMHIQDMYRKHLVIKENILLFDANISQCNMIKTDLEKHFGIKANITPIYARWDIDKMLKQDKYAIILSTKSILGLFDEVPFLKINSFLNDEDYEAIDKIVYKNKPVKIITGGKLIDDHFIFDNIKIKLDKEILFIDDIYLTYTIEPKLRSGVYVSDKGDNKIYIINYDLKDGFIVHHRLINRFGQMLKENKL